jgi:hypothetical protein
MLSQRVNWLRADPIGVVGLVAMGLVLFLASNSVSRLGTVSDDFHEQESYRHRYPPRSHLQIVGPHFRSRFRIRSDRRSILVTLDAPSNVANSPGMDVVLDQ